MLRKYSVGSKTSRTKSLSSRAARLVSTHLVTKFQCSIPQRIGQILDRRSESFERGLENADLFAVFFILLECNALTIPFRREKAVERCSYLPFGVRLMADQLFR